MLKEVTELSEVLDFFNRVIAGPFKAVKLAHIYGLAYRQQQLDAKVKALEEKAISSRSYRIECTTLVSESIAVIEMRYKHPFDSEVLPPAFIPVVHGEATGTTAETFDEALVQALSFKYRSNGWFAPAIYNLLRMDLGGVSAKEGSDENPTSNEG